MLRRSSVLTVPRGTEMGSPSQVQNALSSRASLSDLPRCPLRRPSTVPPGHAVGPRDQLLSRSGTCSVSFTSRCSSGPLILLICAREKVPTQDHRYRPGRDFHKPCCYHQLGRCNDACKPTASASGPVKPSPSQIMWSPSPCRAESVVQCIPPLQLSTGFRT